MNLYDYFRNNINMDRIKGFSGDMYELALIRYVMKESSKLFYRDYTFFLDKENINARDSIYNKKIDLNNTNDFSIVCRSYCDVIKRLMEQIYGVECEVISAFSDRFKHVDLMIKTKTGNKYIVDPLTDLIEMQVGMKTNNFASKKYYETYYKKKLENVSFFTEERLEQIDDKIGYKNGSVYLDDILKKLREKFENIEDFLRENEEISISLLGDKYDGRQFTDDEKMDLKLKYIIRNLNNRRYLNGFVDLVMFSDEVIKRLFSKTEQKKIGTYSFFVDETDLHNAELANTLKSKESRKRGRVVNLHGKNYVFSLGKDVLEYNDYEWKALIEKNRIFVKPEYTVQLLKHLKENGADRNIVHNNEFLRLFNKFEEALLNRGRTIEEIKKENVIIYQDIILTRFGTKCIAYKIENGHLVVIDYEKKIKYIVFYEDEGRHISYKAVSLLKEKNYKETEKEDIDRQDQDIKRCER